MQTLLESKINKAFEKKNSNIKTFAWKGPKSLNSKGQYEQQEKYLIEMDEQELIRCNEHCKKMLFNKDSFNPGRYLVLKIISEQQNKCGAELFIRYLEKEHQISRFSLIGIINNFLTLNKEAFINKVAILGDLFSELEDIYKKLPLNLIMDGCLDRLGAFNKKHVTRTFILKQGIWLSSEEIKEFAETVAIKDRMDTIKEQLGIKEVEKLYINSKGINYTQMRAMLNLRSNKKYMEMTSAQLETLRYRILFNLEEVVKNHILAWEKRMKEIELVASHNNFKL